MNLRRRFIVYLVVVHAMLAAASAYLLRQDRVWLVAVESTFLVTFAWGVLLVTRLSGSLAAVRESSQFLDEGELTTRFREAGHPDVDLLVRVYNRMVDSLRDERVALQEQQYFLGRLIDVSPAGVVILDHDGHVALVNRSAELLLQTTQAVLSGRRLEDVVSPVASLAAAVPPGEARVVAIQGGRRIRCQCATFVERGFPRRFYLLEELTDELRRTEKAAYEKLIRMMSHEVNNSVGATRSLLQSSRVYGSELPPEHQAEFDQAIGVATDRLERLNTFMRGFAEVVRVPEPHKQPTGIEALLEGCARLVQAQTDPARVAWRWDRRDTLGDVNMDPAQMEQVFINIMKNAAEAVGEAGTVTVRLARGADSGVIEVEDTGSGMTDEVRAQVFTPFFTTKQHGQGIGLTLVQEILRKHGFVYALEAPGGGPTVFRVTVPLAERATSINPLA